MKKFISIIAFCLVSALLIAQSLSIASYNMLRLGDGTKDYKTLASVISTFDVCGAIEVMNENGMKQTLQYLPDYKYVISKTSVGTDKYKEYFGVFYNTKKVTVTEIGLYPTTGFVRNPYGVTIKDLNSDFSVNLVIVHIIYGSSEKDRIAEVNNLDELYTYFNKENNTIISGDFNLENVKNFDITKYSTNVSGVNKSTLGMKSASNSYDHMFVSKELVNKIIKSDVDYWTQDWNTRKTVSDHFPVYCIISIK